MAGMWFGSSAVTPQGSVLLGCSAGAEHHGLTRREASVCVFFETIATKSVVPSVSSTSVGMG
jgi:hypothetical protein